MGFARMCIPQALICVLIMSCLTADGGETTTEPTAMIDQAAVAEETSIAETQEVQYAEQTKVRSTEVTEAAQYSCSPRAPTRTSSPL